mmetsp:Transcript_16132/g.35112  ORF Transcript_16132/g.35112 Transcript_16132/m.35112 type:complete len:288 (-) Transcript_16132:804-1667(-)
MGLASPRPGIVENVERDLRLATYLGQVTERPRDSLHGGPVADDRVGFIGRSVQRGFRRRHPREERSDFAATLAAVDIAAVQDVLPLAVYAVPRKAVPLAPDRVGAAPQHRPPEPAHPPAPRGGGGDRLAVDSAVHPPGEGVRALHRRAEGHDAVRPEVHLLQPRVLVPGGGPFVIRIVNVDFFRIVVGRFLYLACICAGLRFESFFLGIIFVYIGNTTFIIVVIIACIPLCLCILSGVKLVRSLTPIVSGHGGVSSTYVVRIQVHDGCFKDLDTNRQPRLVLLRHSR